MYPIMSYLHEVNKFLSTIAPFVYLAIGSLLAPFFHRIIGMSDRRNAAKAELCQSISALVNCRRDFITMMNYKDLDNARLNIIYQNLNSYLQPSPQRDEWIRQYDRLSENVKYAMERLNMYHARMYEAEAKAILVRIEMQRLYPKKVYNKLHQFVSRMLADIGREDNLLLHNYFKLTPKELNNLAPVLPQELQRVSSQMAQMSNSAIDQINALLK